MNPVLILANNELSQKPRSGDSQRLQREFGQAMVTRTGSQGFTNLTNLFNRYDDWNPFVGWRTGEEGAWREGNFLRLKESRPWLGGCLMMIVDKKQGVRERVIKSLNLRVSIHLQPPHHPVMISTENISNPSPTLNPLSEWVVDITDAGDLVRRKYMVNIGRTISGVEKKQDSIWQASGFGRYVNHSCIPTPGYAVVLSHRFTLTPALTSLRHQIAIPGPRTT